MLNVDGFEPCPCDQGMIPANDNPDPNWRRDNPKAVDRAAAAAHYLALADEARALRAKKRDGSV